MAELEKVYKGRYAQEYDQRREIQPNWQIEQATIVRELGRVQPGERVLDVAAGTGRWLEALKDRRAEVTLVDVSDDMLQKARERADSIGFAVSMQVGNALAMATLPSCDWMISTRFFNWVPLTDVERVLEKAARAGARGYIFSIRFLDRDRRAPSLSWRLRELRSTVRNAVGIGKKATYHLHKEQDVRDMLSRQGLSIAGETVLVDSGERKKVCFTLIRDPAPAE
jgi:ubiquinone/menaquinone biosynthesis C-methylase UbiE